MNIFKKIYCRGYQGVFRLAIPFLPYKAPVLLEGIEAVPGALKKENVKSVLLVTGPSVRSHGLTRPLEELLINEGFALTVFDKNVPNPTEDNVEEALKMYHANNCQAIIGFGGGSPIDCAKAVGARVAHPKKSLSQLAGVMKVTKKIPPLFAIPTTAGSGSETTVAAVITNSNTQHKYAINSFTLIPKYAVLDANATKTLPKSMTATTGMDALTHAVEAYIGNSTTKDTRECSEKAVKLIFENIRTAYEDGDNLEARRNMLHASYLAGHAFTVSYVGYVHAVAHTLGGKYNVPHGLANAVLLPYVLTAYGEKIWPKLHKLAVCAGIAKESDSHKEAAEKFIYEIKRMQTDLNIGDKIPGILEEDIPQMAAYANREGNPLYPVPVLMDASELEVFYRLIME